MASSLGQLAARVGQQVKEAVGVREARTEYPPSFLEQDAAVRAARDLSEALAKALSRHAGSFHYTELSPFQDGFGGRVSYSGALGRAAMGLADVLSRESAYRRDLMAVADAAVELELLEGRLVAELDIAVLQPYRAWLRGPGNDFLRARRTLGQLRLDKDAADAADSDDAGRRFHQQLRLVSLLLERVPGQLEEHRRLLRAYLRLLAAHSAATSAIYARTLARLSPDPA